MKKVFSFLSVLFLGVMILAGCGKSESKSDNNKKYVATYNDSKIYKAEVTKVATNDSGDWVLTGKTNAPDGAKIIVTPSNPNEINFGQISSESPARAKWPVADEGEFTVLSDAIELMDEQKEGNKIKVLVFAITKYNKDWTSSTVPKKLVMTAKKELSSKTLTLTKDQQKYYDSLDDEDSDTDSDTDSNTDTDTESKSDSTSSKTADKTDKEDVPTEYKNALASGQQYADDMDMSYAGIKDQLTDPDGEGFEAPAVDWAMPKIKADWNKNALNSAKSYQEMNMSKAEILEQLQGSDGEGFTPEQAQYAVDHLE